MGRGGIRAREYPVAWLRYSFTTRALRYILIEAVARAVPVRQVRVVVGSPCIADVVSICMYMRVTSCPDPDLAETRNASHSIDIYRYGIRLA